MSNLTMKVRNKTIELTKEDWMDISGDSQTRAVKSEKLTKEEIVKLAEKLNEKIDIPIIGEKWEAKILIKVIKIVDGFLYDHLPNELYDLVKNINDGISEEEAKEMTERFSRFANEKINIPFVSEHHEYIGLRFIIGIIVHAMRKAFDFDKAFQEAEKLNIID